MLTHHLWRGSALAALSALVAACGAAVAPAPTAAPTSAPTQISAPTSAPTQRPIQPTSAPQAADPLLAAVYDHLGRSPEQVNDTVVVEAVQGTYARVALLPTVGDGLWLFMQQSQGGWFVLAEVSMTAQPDLSLPREKGVPEELLQGLASASEPSSQALAQGELTVSFDSSVEFPPSARVYLVNVDGSGYIAADMPEQAVGQPFSIAAPVGLYYVYARSTRFEDIGFFALWDAETIEAPALAHIDIQQGRTTGPLALQRSPDPCNPKYALPVSPDGVFPATDTAQYRNALQCP